MLPGATGTPITSGRFRFLGTHGTISILATASTNFDTGGMKRTVQVNVKMTSEDFALLRKAAEKKWPDAVLTNSGIVLALARIAAREILGGPTRPKSRG